MPNSFQKKDPRGSENIAHYSGRIPWTRSTVLLLCDRLGEKRLRFGEVTHELRIWSDFELKQCLLFAAQFDAGWTEEQQAVKRQQEIESGDRAIYEGRIEIERLTKTINDRARFVADYVAIALIQGRNQLSRIPLSSPRNEKTDEEFIRLIDDALWRCPDPIIKPRKKLKDSFVIGRILD